MATGRHGQHVSNVPLAKAQHGFIGTKPRNRQRRRTGEVLVEWLDVPRFNRICGDEAQGAERGQGLSIQYVKDGRLYVGVDPREKHQGRNGIAQGKGYTRAVRVGEIIWSGGKMVGLAVLVKLTIEVGSFP